MTFFHTIAPSSPPLALSSRPKATGIARIVDSNPELL